MMTNEFMKVYRLKITTYSPVHIGDSRDLEPTEYVICSESEKADCVVCPECGAKNPANARDCGICGEPLPRAPVFLYTFTPQQLSEALSPADKQQLLRIVKSDSVNSLKELQKFFRARAAFIAKHADKRSKVCPEIAKKYEKAETDNRFRIEKQISDSVTGLPYIPGSSLKGAIRTALMSVKAEKLHVHKNDFKKSADAEKMLYGYDDPTDDPFKSLKLGDAVAVLPFMTEIDTAENVKRKENKAVSQKGVSVYMEIIPSKIVFKSTLTFSCGSDSVRRFGETIESIRHACNDFYSDILNDQSDRQTIVHGIDSRLFEEIRNASNRSNAFLLCLGKHGGAESKTVESLRNIKIMTGKDPKTGKSTSKYLDHATTYWFAKNGTERRPFGWCVVEFEEVK